MTAAEYRAMQELIASKSKKAIAPVKKRVKKVYPQKETEVDGNRIKVFVKPMSVNGVFKGRRFRTTKYDEYEAKVMGLLPKLEIGKAPYSITFIFGFSNSLCDFDNPVKPMTDILQKYYIFNDRDIVEAHIYKVQVEKGSEYCSFEIKSI
jgi:Holliday junction resolvase RusA-like endonuclease